MKQHILSAETSRKVKKKKNNIRRKKAVTLKSYTDVFILYLSSFNSDEPWGSSLLMNSSNDEFKMQSN